MKKILLIIILTLPLFHRVMNVSSHSLWVQVTENGFSKKEKNKSWEYVKENLFENKIDRESMVPKKINGPILFVLKNATRLDSLAVENTMRELREVIPHKKVVYFSSFSKVDFSKFTTDSSFKKQKTENYSYNDILLSTVKINFEKDQYKNKRGVNEVERLLYFSFRAETSLEDRQKYIRYEVLKTICYAHKKSNNSPFLNIKYPTEATFNDPVYNVLDKEFTGLDKFLVQKLYADDFETQFSAYMYNTYPWRYASVFVNKDAFKLKGYMLIGVLGVLFFVLSFIVFNQKKKNYWAYFFPLLVVFIGIVNLHGLYVYFVEVQQSFGVLKNTIDVLLYVLLAALFVSLFLYFTERKIEEKQLGFTYLFIMKLVLTFVSLNFSVSLGYYLIVDKVDGIIPLYVSLFYVFLVLTLGRGLLIYLNHYSASLVKQKEIELGKLKELNTENELKSLHAHINPHFLYNALNSIASLTHKNPTKTEEMILALSDLFRYSINRKGKKMSTIEDEVLMVENYLKIEKIRFEERLQYTIDVNEKLLEKEIPMYLLQPLIENAVKHGVSKTKKTGEIHLRIKKENRGLLITIKDNGDHFPEDLYGGYGLQSVYDLLRLSYGDKAMLQWANEPEKKISILIPSNE